MTSARLYATARRVAADGTVSNRTRALALPLLWRFGDASDLPAMTALRDDASVVYVQSWNSRPMQVQVRDLAVGLGLMTSGADPAKFGFPVLTDHPWKIGRDYTQWPIRFFGFVTEAQREAAHRQAREWLGAR